MDLFTILVFREISVKDRITDHPLIKYTSHRSVKGRYVAQESNAGTTLQTIPTKRYLSKKLVETLTYFPSKWLWKGYKVDRSNYCCGANLVSKKHPTDQPWGDLKDWNPVNTEFLNYSQHWTSSCRLVIGPVAGGLGSTRGLFPRRG